MSPEDTRLECLRIADGDVAAAQKMLDFVHQKADGAKSDSIKCTGDMQMWGSTIPVNSAAAGMNASLAALKAHRGCGECNTRAADGLRGGQAQNVSPVPDLGKMNNAQLAAVLGAEADDRGLADRVRGGGLWFWDGKSFKRV